MSYIVSTTHTFGGLSSPVPLSYLDDDFGNLVTAFGNSNAFSNYIVDTGAVNTYAVTLAAGITFTLSAGLQFQIKIANTNSGASTLAINGGAAKSIKWQDGSALAAGALVSGGIYSMMYDGTNYQLLSGINLVSPSILTSITTPSTTFSLVNTTATTVNFAGGASTALNIGNASGTNTVLGNTNFSQVVKVATTLGVGGATPAASGAGITFPATQSASSDANTLDDYEEGTWTPSVGGSATYTTQTGIYTKIGRTVWIGCTFQINAIGTGSQSEISGLPFTSSVNPNTNAISIGYFGSLAASVYYISGYVEANATKVTFVTLTAAAATCVNGPNILGSSTRVDFAGTYGT